MLQEPISEQLVKHISSVMFDGQKQWGFTINISQVQLISDELWILNCFFKDFHVVLDDGIVEWGVTLMVLKCWVVLPYQL